MQQNDIPKGSQKLYARDTMSGKSSYNKYQHINFGCQNEVLFKNRHHFIHLP